MATFSGLGTLTKHSIMSAKLFLILSLDFLQSPPNVSKGPQLAFPLLFLLITLFSTWTASSKTRQTHFFFLGQIP
jgi:hypothetical protein